MSPPPRLPTPKGGYRPTDERVRQFRRPAFVGVSLDCADPAELADFYLRLLGGRVLWSRPNSVGAQLLGLLLVLQRVADYRPPVWPGASIVHLNLTAGEELEAPVKRALELGARLAEPQPD